MELRELKGYEGYFASGYIIHLLQEDLPVALNNLISIRLYSLLPVKYHESEGRKDIGTNLWNKGRTQEISQRVNHL